MTIRTTCQVYCDIGLKCTKQVIKTIEGGAAPVEIRAWARGNGWHTYGGRDACPDCWKELHSATKPPEQVVQEAIDEEELQRAIELRRGARTAER